MEMSISDAGGVAIIRFEGRLDGQSSPAALQAFQQLMEQGKTRILANFEQLSFISSVGLRVLLIVAKEISHRQGEVRVCHANPLVTSVFEVSGFNTIISMLETESEALAVWV